MAERTALPKKVRFEVFKRDSFTCQYCGRSAPNVILEVDHIVPVAEGGTNEVINLITSCRDCNRGKGARLLSSTETIDKQKKQLDELNEMREQTDMMVEWKKELLQLENRQAEEIENLLDSLTGFTLTDLGLRNVRKRIREFGFAIVYEAMEVACSQYFNGSSQSVELLLNKLGGICYNRSKGKKHAWDEVAE